MKIRFKMDGWANVAAACAVLLVYILHVRIGW